MSHAGDSPCTGDCDGQNYPFYPYDDGVDSLFGKALPIMLSAFVVVISWLAGRFIDKIDVASAGSLPRIKSANFGQVHRSASEDKNAGFHSSARNADTHEGGGKIIEGVQELEAISVADDEGRLYNETYGSEHSRDDGARYDALGDSPGAQGPPSQGPRSPSVYSHFSQSVFSQSAYGPSAYGPSQRRPTVLGSQVGSSAYDVSSSAGGSGGSQYIGPAPSHFGASQLSEGASFNGGPGGVMYGNTHMAGAYPGAPGNAGHGGVAVARGMGGSGGIGARSGSGGSALGAAPPYDPNALPAGAPGAAMVGGGVAGDGPAASGVAGAELGGTSNARVSAGVAPGAGGAVAGVYVPMSRGSPPPYSQANMLTPASVLPRDDGRCSLEPHTQVGHPVATPKEEPAPRSWGDGVEARGEAGPEGSAMEL